MAIQGYAKPGPGFDKSKYPRRRFLLFIMFYFELFWKLIRLNLTFVLGCLPVLTIPAAISGLNYVCARFARDEHAFVWHDFWAAFKRDFWKSELYGLIIAAAAFVAAVAFRYYLTFMDSGLWFMIPVVLVIMCAIVFAAMSNYVQVMIPSVDLPLRVLMANALKLCFIKPLGTLVTLAMEAGLVYVSIKLYPLGLLVPLILGFSLVGFASCFNAWPQIERYIIRPHEEKGADA